MTPVTSSLFLVDKGSLRKDNYSEYRKILSGKIEYCPPNLQSKGFTGYIKLKKDPRAEPLSDVNFIPRGSILKNTEWYLMNILLKISF